MFCNQCGESGEGRFCENCGAPLVQRTPTDPPADWAGNTKTDSAPSAYDAPQQYEPPVAYDIPQQYSDPQQYAPPVAYDIPQQYGDLQQYEPPVAYDIPQQYSEPQQYAPPAAYDTPQQYGDPQQPYPPPPYAPTQYAAQPAAPQYYNSPALYQPNAQQKKKSKTLVIVLVVVCVVVLALVGLVISLLSRSSANNGAAVTPPVTQGPGNGGSSGNGSALDPNGGSEKDPNAFVYPTDNDPIAGATESFSVVLPPGHYTAGVDIPVGYYKFYCVAGFGNVWTSNYNDASWINEILGYEMDAYEGSYTDEVFLSKGTVLSLLGPTIRIEATRADVKNLQPRVNPLTEGLTLKAGEYVVGKDIPAGVYDFECIKGYLYCTGEREEDDFSIDTDLNEIVESNYEEHEFNNVILSAGTVLILEGDGTVVLTPSKGSMPRK